MTGLPTPADRPADDRDPFEVAYDAEQGGCELTPTERAALRAALGLPVEERTS